MSRDVTTAKQIYRYGEKTDKESQLANNNSKGSLTLEIY